MLVGDELVVLGGAEAGGHGLVGVHEALEVGVDVEGAGVGEGEGGGVVALGEGDEGFGGGGALEVEVELGLGEVEKPGAGVLLAGGAGLRDFGTGLVYAAGWGWSREREAGSSLRSTNDRCLRCRGGSVRGFTWGGVGRWRTVTAEPSARRMLSGGRVARWAKAGP